MNYQAKTAQATFATEAKARAFNKKCGNMGEVNGCVFTVSRSMKFGFVTTDMCNWAKSCGATETAEF
jgi:hypothetical protein